jgi:undecaprenyl phosphate-alpha-L-ara4FN deformylase
VSLAVALRIDVDTYVGARDGVPALLDELARRDAKASFFLSLGPDTAGRAALRLFTRPGFLTKMLRTKAVSTYGLRTVLSGTLLPATRIGAACEATYREIAAAGHEVALHAWDHFRWQDHLTRWSREEVAAEYGRGFDEFTRIYGRRPDAVAAPGWVASPASFAASDALGLAYASDTRGTRPFRPVVGGRALGTLQVPVTLPTFDECVGRDGLGPAGWNDALLARIGTSGEHVYTLHTEVEGRGQRAEFGRLLDALRGRGATFPTLREVAERARDVPTCPVEWRPIEGRAGDVACQGAPAPPVGAAR